MSIIDLSYFHSELRIPNLDTANNQVQAAVQADIEAFIAKWEPVILKKLLSEDTCAALIEGMEEDPIPPPWPELLLQLRDETNKVSPIANYVWCKYFKARAFNNVGLLDLVPRFENSDIAQVQAKYIGNHNDALPMWEKIIDFLEENEYQYDCKANGADWNTFLYDSQTINQFGI